MTRPDDRSYCNVVTYPPTIESTDRRRQADRQTGWGLASWMSLLWSRTMAAIGWDTHTLVVRFKGEAHSPDYCTLEPHEQDLRNALACARV